MTRILATIALLTLAACQLTETTEEDGGVVAPVEEGGASHLLVETQCKSAGGTMVVGLAGPTCARPQPDAGKSCSDSGDCAGFCLAETRSCSPVTPYFGCHEILQGGKSVGLCID